MKIASLAASTVAFLAASYFTKRWLEDNDIPKGVARGALIFSIALAAAYGVGWIVDHVA
jgi:hypothetical protein